MSAAARKQKRSAAGPLLAAALLVSGAGPARCIEPSAGTSGASFMKIGMGSTRALSLGRAYVALAEGTDAIGWNPAGLGLSQQREFAVSWLDYIQGAGHALGARPAYFAYAHPLGRTVFGANFGYMVVDGFDVRDAQGRRQYGADVEVTDTFSTLSLARSFWYEKLYLGAGVKLVHEDNDGTTHSVLAGDLGALLKPNSFVTFGFATQNFGAGAEKIAAVNRGGASVQILELLTASVEIAKYSDGPARLGIGGEFMLPEDLLQLGQVYLRVGYRGADDMGNVLEDDRHWLYPLISSPKLSYGIGIYTARAFGYGIAFDYALISYGMLGTANSATLKVKF